MVIEQKIAKVNDLMMVTNNTDDYRDFQDLKVENRFTSQRLLQYELRYDDR
jgi:hypothetical protein